MRGAPGECLELAQVGLEQRAARSQRAHQRQRDRDREAKRQDADTDIDPQSTIVDGRDRRGIGPRGGLVDLDEVGDRLRDLRDQLRGPGLVPQVREKRLQPVPRASASATSGTGCRRFSRTCGTSPGPRS